MLVHVKNRSNINLACADPASDSKSRIPALRPASAPSTKRESLRAFRRAGQTGHLAAALPEGSAATSVAPTPPRRPHTTYGGHRRSLTPDSEGQGPLFTPLARETLSNGAL